MSTGKNEENYPLFLFSEYPVTAISAGTGGNGRTLQGACTGAG